MTVDEENSELDDNSIVFRFKEDLRICREALLEAKQRIIILEQRLRVFLTCLIVLLGCTMLYGVVQIYQTSNFLQDLGHYVRQERDPRWEKLINEIRGDQTVIKSTLSELKIK